MAEQQTEPVWRVVTHARNGGGWWTVAPCAAFGVRRAAFGGVALVQATSSATGRTPTAKERTPKEVPGWIKGREGERAT